MERTYGYIDATYDYAGGICDYVKGAYDYVNATCDYAKGTRKICKRGILAILLGSGYADRRWPTADLLCKSTKFFHAFLALFPNLLPLHSHPI